MHTLGRDVHAGVAWARLKCHGHRTSLLQKKLFATPMNTNSSGGRGGIMHAQALDYAMHTEARLCTMHFDEDTRGLQTRGILGLLTLCRLAAGGTPRYSSFSDNGRISSSCKASSAVETCAGAFWCTKLPMINTTNKLHWTRVKQNIMHDNAKWPNCELCTTMHNYARASPPPPSSLTSLTSWRGKPLHQGSSRSVHAHTHTHTHTCSIQYSTIQTVGVHLVHTHTLCKELPNC